MLKCSPCFLKGYVDIEDSVVEANRNQYGKDGVATTPSRLNVTAPKTITLKNETLDVTIQMLDFLNSTVKGSAT